MLEGRVKYSKRGGGVLLFVYLDKNADSAKVEVPIAFMEEHKSIDLLHAKIKLKRYSFVRLCRIKDEEAINFKMWNKLVNYEKLGDAPSAFEEEEEEESHKHFKTFIEAIEFEILKRGEDEVNQKEDVNKPPACVGQGLLTACSAIFPNKDGDLEFYCEVDYQHVIICRGDRVCRVRPFLCLFRCFQFFGSSSSSTVCDVKIVSFTPRSNEMLDLNSINHSTPFVSYTGK